MTTLIPKYTLAVSNAINRPFNEKLKESISAADFGFSTTASGSVNANAIANAIAYLNSVTGGFGGEVYLPRGVYTVAPDIISLATSRFVTLRGAASAFGYNAPHAATQLVFTVGSIGIDGYDVTIVLAQGNKICDLEINGNAVLNVGIRVNTNCTIEDVSVYQCINAGITLADYTNSVTLNRVSCNNNYAGGGTGYGLLVQGTNTTVWSVNNSNFRDNNVGIRIEAGAGFSITQTVVESNYAEGVSIYRPNAATPILNSTFTTVWLENNYRDGGIGYGLVINAGTPDSGTSTPVNIIFNQCSISAVGTAKHLNINAARGIVFDTCTMTGGDTVNGILIASTGVALEIYVRGRNQLEVGLDATGRQFSATPTAFIPTTSYNTASNKTYEVSKLVTQLSGSGPTTIFTISNLTSGDYGTCQIDLAGAFQGSDIGYRSYIGQWQQSGGTAAMTLSPVNIDAGATSKLSGSFATITGANSSGNLLVQLTLGAFSGGNSFVGSIALRITGGQSDISISQ